MTMPGSCPGREALMSFLEKRFSGANADAIGEHLITCPDCKQHAIALSSQQAVVDAILAWSSDARRREQAASAQPAAPSVAPSPPPQANSPSVPSTAPPERAASSPRSSPAAAMAQPGSPASSAIDQSGSPASSASAQPGSPASSAIGQSGSPASSASAQPGSPAAIAEAEPASVTATSGISSNAPNSRGDFAHTEVDPREFLDPPQLTGEIGRIAQYRVLELLGEGGMGLVYRGEDTQLGRSVALKVMRPSVAQSPIARGRFLREARAIAAVDHDHIVTIYQVGESNGLPFLAMPLLQGETLDHLLKRTGRIPVADALRIARQVAEGLSAAHARGLIHRDIKPGNIWIEPHKNRIKILDFGLARESDASETELTQTGMIIGTPAYMAPEQAANERLDQRSDLFSLGSVLYRMVTGVPPFKGSSSIAILRSLAIEHPKPPHEVQPDIPIEVSKFINKLLRKDPNRRPQTARDVATLIAGLEANLLQPREHAHKTPPAPRPAIPAATPKTPPAPPAPPAPPPAPATTAPTALQRALSGDVGLEPEVDEPPLKPSAKPAAAGTPQASVPSSAPAQGRSAVAPGRSHVGAAQPSGSGVRAPSHATPGASGARAAQPDPGRSSADQGARTRAPTSETGPRPDPSFLFEESLPPPVPFGAQRQVKRSRPINWPIVISFGVLLMMTVLAVIMFLNKK